MYIYIKIIYIYIYIRRKTIRTKLRGESNKIENTDFHRKINCTYIIDTEIIPFFVIYYIIHIHDFDDIVVSLHIALKHVDFTFSDECFLYINS